MRPEEVEKLLAGYAAGTLDEHERRVLMRAALERQELFDALVEEDALKELLEDPRCRRQLLELLGAPRRPLWRRAWDWLMRPARIAAVASATAALVLISAFLIHLVRREPIGPLAPALAPAPQVARAPASAEAEVPAGAATPARPRVEAPPPRAVRVAKPGSRPARPPVTAAPQRAATVAPLEAEAVRAERRAVALQEKVAAPVFTAALRAADEAVLPAGLRVRLLRDGVEVKAGEEFAVQDALILRVEVAQAGRLWLYRRMGEGALERLIVAGVEDRPITPGAPLDIPLPPRERPGEEHFVLVLAPETSPPRRAVLGAREQSPRPTQATAPAPPRVTIPLTLRFR